MVNVKKRLRNRIIRGRNIVHRALSPENKKRFPNRMGESFHYANTPPKVFKLKYSKA